MTGQPLDSRYFGGLPRWLTRPSDRELDGFEVVDWKWLRETWVSRARAVGIRRRSVESASSAWLNWLDQVDRLAIVGVRLDSPSAAADLLGFVVEPATRRGIELVIGADRPLEQVDQALLFEPEFGYPYSLERLHWRFHNDHRPGQRGNRQLPDTGFAPDPMQAEAVSAPVEGVVQVLAPAGSGKTTVLIERVRELRRRGVSADAITCLTFNRAARAELTQRLSEAGVGDVNALTFHGLGRRILIEAGRLPRTTRIGSPSLANWRRLAAEAKKEAGENGIWLDPWKAQSELSHIKLGLLQTSAQYAANITAESEPVAHTMAALYKAYDERQRRDERVDYDDLILRAVLLLRHDAKVRGAWQAKCQHVLVDEYQDIEPAQELVVRLVAAPHDQIFCVGDEDQTLYAFRRASVERIILLDGLYPGLTRVSLRINYRCPAAIVSASRKLIEHNQYRFRKEIYPSDDNGECGVALHRVTKQSEAAVEIAKLLGTKKRDEIVVLARTTNALRPIALACVDLGVPIDGHDKLFEPAGARRALEHHIRLALLPRTATTELVRSVCQTPARHLAYGAEKAVAEQLRAGKSLENVFAGVEAPRRRPRTGPALIAPGELFGLLADCEDAGAAVALLRGPGGLDQWFEDEDNLGGLDQFECEVLEQAEHDARGRTPRQYLDTLTEQGKALRASRDRERGIALKTIHGAKGLQWQHVVLIAFDEGTLPHTRSLQVGYEDLARGEGVEAERRLGYVALTRAQRRLDLYYDAERPSRFLRESELLSAQRREARVPPPPPDPRTTASSPTDVRRVPETHKSVRPSRRLRALLRRDR